MVLFLKRLMLLEKYGLDYSSINIHQYMACLLKSDDPKADYLFEPNASSEFYENYVWYLLNSYYFGDCRDSFELYEMVSLFKDSLKRALLYGVNEEIQTPIYHRYKIMNLKQIPYYNDRIFNIWEQIKNEKNGIQKIINEYLFSGISNTIIDYL